MSDAENDVGFVGVLFPILTLRGLPPEHFDKLTLEELLTLDFSFKMCDAIFSSVFGGLTSIML